MKKISLIISILFHLLDIMGQMPVMNPYIPSIISDTSKIISIQSELSEIYTPELPQIIPASPQSKMFEKYINHEVTEYNGLPVIEIPLYEIEIKGLKIPISLSYHAGGIKYLQYDGDVAAGWSVNAGGYRISRTIKGKADEAYPRYNEDEYNSKSPEKSTTYFGYLASIAHDENSIDEYMSACKNTYNYPYLDGEYDHFSYMIPGKSGQFLIVDRDNRSTRKVVGTNPYDQIILANTANLYLDDMYIVDTDGFTYYMGKHPVTSDILSEGPHAASPYRTGWPLRQIKSPYNETVEFEYVKHNVSHDRTDVFSDDYNTFQVTHATITSDDQGALWNTAAPESYSFPPTFEKSYGNLYETCFISEIRTNKEIIEFVRYRYDMYSTDYVLRYIIIKTISGEERKRISFSYNPPGADHRLLESITIDNQVYNFTYYELPDNGQSQYLYSDIWGYYNVSSQVNSQLNYLDERYKNDEIGTLSGSKKLKDLSHWQSQMVWVNRESNDNTSHAFSLKTIFYPTGGYTEYIYEPNQYEDWSKPERPVIIGAGQRIKKIISKTDNASKPITTVFKYGENECGYSYMNQLNRSKIHHNYVKEHHTINVETVGIAYHQRITTTANYSSRKSFESDLNAEPGIVYSQVAKYQYDGNEHLGKTVSYYNVDSGLPYGTSQYSCGSNNSHFNHSDRDYVSTYYMGKKAFMDSTKVYDRTNNLIQKELYKHSWNSSSGTFNGVRASQIGSIVGSGWSLYFIHNDLNSILHADLFVSMRTWTNIKGVALLTNKITTTYEGGKAITTVQTNHYNSKNQLSQMFLTNSTGANIIKTYKYPFDFNIYPYTEMVSKNMISTVIEQTTKNNNKVIGWKKNHYFQDAIKTNNLILPQKVETSSDGAARTDLTYDLYDEKGNLLQYTTLGGRSTSYLWSYNYQYPVAEIKNATYDEVKQALGSVSPESISSLSQPNMTVINSLRDKLPNALITTYTYKPLAGIETITDPRGVVTTHEYDEFGQLKFIKDNNGHLIEEYKYNYRNK